jgi:hypothetical protein
MMWIRRRLKSGDGAIAETQVTPLQQAIRQTRIETAERSAVVVEMRDAELARLELLNDALDTLFKDVPSGVDLFDRGISRGETPRLWIDAIAHVAMGRDKRRYRFIQDTRYGRKVLADSTDIPEIVKAVTHYVAYRLIERERALAAGESALAQNPTLARPRHGLGRAILMFLVGLVLGAAAIVAALWIAASQAAQ